MKLRNRVLSIYTPAIYRLAFPQPQPARSPCLWDEGKAPFQSIGCVGGDRSRNGYSVSSNSHKRHQDPPPHNRYDAFHRRALKICPIHHQSIIPPCLYRQLLPIFTTLSCLANFRCFYCCKKRLRSTSHVLTMRHYR